MTQALMERKRREKQAEGAKIHTTGASSLPARHVGRVRFYVAADYREQHPTWRRQLEDLIDAANPVLRPAFGVQLQVSELHEWSPTCDRGDLEACLDELSEIEAGAGGEWVVGVLGAQPRFTTSFEELGIAAVPGSHFILRDVSDLAERDAIDRSFTTHTQQQRDDIYTRRKQHKRLAIFLHEWAHTLGSLHTRASEALLNPAYDERMSTFDDANAGLIAAAITDRFGQDAHDQALLAYLDTTSTPDLDQAARAALLDRLKHPAAAPVTASATALRTHPFVVAGADDELLTDLEPKARGTYHKAVELLLEDDPLQALLTVGPLAQASPNNYAIQHLACALAMQQGLQADAQIFCVRMQEASKGRGR